MTKKAWYFGGVVAIALAVTLAGNPASRVDASGKKRASEASPNWEERVLGLRRPTEPRYDQYWRAQLYTQLHSKQAQSKDDPLAWLLGSPVFEHISAPARQVLAWRYGLLPPGAATDAQSGLRIADTPGRLAAGIAPGQNIMINDPKQDVDPHVQNQTASAAFGDKIVVVYNHSSDFLTRASHTADGGLTWQETIVSSVPNGFNLGDGVVAADGDGNFYISTTALNDSNIPTVAVTKSTDGGASWLTASDAVTVELNARAFHNKPWIAVDSTASKFRGAVYVSWTKFDDKSKRATIMFARSTDKGASFNRPIEITTDTKGFDVEGSRLTVGPAGEIYIAWLDERITGINIARSTDGGLTFSKPATAVALGELRTPEFLNGHFKTNIFPSLAVDLSDGKTRGRLYITYNARPSLNSIDKSDVFLISSSDGGQTWSAPTRINDDGTITDQWMPSVAVTPSGKVAVLWYDRRNDKINDALVDVYMASSFDGGQSFRANVRVTSSNWPLVPTPLSLRFGYHGDYNQISTRGELLNLNWGDDRNGTDPNVYFATLPIDAVSGDDFTLSARTIAVELRAGEDANFVLESSNINAFIYNIKLSAASSLPNASFDFSTDEIQSGNGFNLKVTVPPGTKAGTYPVIVTGTAGAQSRATTVRVVVLGNNLAAKPAKNITRTTGDSARPKLAVDAQGVVHMIWQDDTFGSTQIFYARAADGENFSTPLNVSRSFDSAMRPNWAIDTNGRIHVVWEERQGASSIIVYTRSDDGGASFIPKRVVSNGVEVAFDAAISTDTKGAINLVWTGKPLASGNVSAIFFARSTDGGENFTTPKIVQSSSGQVFFEPTVTVDRIGTIHIGYSFMAVTVQIFNTPNFSASVFYVRSMDNGLSFTEPVNVIRSFSLTESPVLLADGAGTVMLLFAGFDNKQLFPSREIYLSRSFDNGASFSLIQIFVGNGDSTNEVASLDPAGNLIVVWRDTQPGNYDIFMSRLFVNEQAFTAPLDISQNIGISDHPSMAIDAKGNIAIAWEDETAGNNEIFYTRLTPEDFPLPSITSFSPTQGNVGDTIEVRGANFENLVDVKIASLSTKITSVADNRLLVTVPLGAVAGPILVVTKSGIARSSSDFLVTGKVGATPTRLDFGLVGVGQSATRTVKVINTADSARKISAVSSDNKAFGLGSIALPITLQPGASLDIPLVFKPVNLSFQTARASIVSDDKLTAQLTIALTGVGTDTQPPEVAIQSPKGGEVFRPGAQVEITWTASDNSAIAAQEILLSTDGGTTFPIVIASGLSGERSFTWTVPEIDTRTARIRVTAMDLAGNRGDATTADFRIKVKKKR